MIGSPMPRIPDRQPAVSDVMEAYTQLLPRQSQFTERLRQLLAELLRQAEIEVLEIQGRTKSAESLAQKLARWPGYYRDPLTEMADLSGVRIIAYYLEDVERITDLLVHQLDVDIRNSGDRGESLEVGEFGYLSRHLIVRLGADRARLPEWRELTGFQAEIQVRTILQHAWSAVSHKIAYKREDEIPKPLRRRLSRLSALFELADEQFAELRADSAQLEAGYAEKINAGMLDIPLNARSLAAYLGRPHFRLHVAEVMRSTGWTLIDIDDDTEKLYAQDRSDLLRILNDIGMESIERLDRVLRGPGFVVSLKALGASHAAARLKSEATPEDAIARACIVLAAPPGYALVSVYSTQVARILHETQSRIIDGR
jgi:putative GTP pyrophosphokinase